MGAYVTEAGPQGTRGTPRLGTSGGCSHSLGSKEGVEGLLLESLGWDTGE